MTCLGEVLGVWKKLAIIGTKFIALQTTGFQGKAIFLVQWPLQMAESLGQSIKTEALEKLTRRNKKVRRPAFFINFGPYAKSQLPAVLAFEQILLAEHLILSASISRSCRTFFSLRDVLTNCVEFGAQH
jgi:hypothetical protein